MKFCHGFAQSVDVPREAHEALKGKDRDELLNMKWKGRAAQSESLGEC